VNELKAPVEEVKDSQFSMKFLRRLPKRFDTLIIMLVKTTLSESTPQQVFQEVMTDDAYGEDDEKDELIKKKNKDGEKKDDEKKKSVAFKASTSKGKAKVESSSEGEACSCDSDEDKEMALLVKKFGKFMKKKSYWARRKKSSSKKNDHAMRCFRCHSKDHLIAKCPYDSDDEYAIKKERRKQKKKQEKKEGSNKKGDAHVATWDSEIISFRQLEEEFLGKSWDHFINLTLTGPKLSIPEEVLLIHFFEGLQRILLSPTC